MTRTTYGIYPYNGVSTGGLFFVPVSRVPRLTHKRTNDHQT